MWRRGARGGGVGFDFRRGGRRGGGGCRGEGGGRKVVVRRGWDGDECHAMTQATLRCWGDWRIVVGRTLRGGGEFRSLKRALRTGAFGGKNQESGAALWSLRLPALCPGVLGGAASVCL